MSAPLHLRHQKEVDGLERTQITIAKKKFKTVLSANKVMCTVFRDAKGITWKEYLLKGTTINAERYCERLKNLCKAIKKRVILLHDNAQMSHKSFRSNFNGTYLDILLIPPTSLHPILHFFQPSRSHFVGKSFLMMKKSKLLRKIISQIGARSSTNRAHKN